jgi:uracil-DNA glycosylase
MIGFAVPDDFDGWRDQARHLLQANIAPPGVSWGAPSLFGQSAEPRRNEGSPVRASTEFIKLAQTIFMHSDPERFDLLYRLLWRLQSNRLLLSDATDKDVVKAGLLTKAIRRDIHKMRAFVRFQVVAGANGEERYVAWFEPDHDIVRANAAFFMQRFANMHWSILTPKLCLHWDTETLQESDGIAKPAASGDPAEDLWKSYYASTFNPARLKTKAMLKEMPRRYWKNMPETAQIAQLIAGAQAREAAMIAVGSAPAEAAPENWAELKSGIDGCTRCPLHCAATQAVHGEGPDGARLMIVGEQPGDREDLTGRPFVGPAGQILDAGMAQAGIERDAAYLTNAVKHFKFQQRGKLRLHQSPNAGEIDHCRWWLDTERRLLKPQLTLALGASAARGLLGRTVNISQVRGKPLDLPGGGTMIVTTHPSYILRVGDRQRDKAMADFAADLGIVAELLGASSA